MVFLVGRMQLEEVFLLLNSQIEVLEHVSERVFVHYESSSIGGKDFLHHLIKEVIAELTLGDAAILVYDAGGDIQEAL